jgi:hypothetical protein
MPFLKAGFNAHNRCTGIFAFTTHRDGNRGGVWPAELRQFDSGGDYFWFGDRGKGLGGFIAWGECVVIHSRREIELPFRLRYEAPRSPL